jgi:cold shock CspA family protein
MRTHGTLTKWNDDRGFGFIEPTVGTEEIFVHVSAFPRDGIRSRIGELVSFEIDLRSDGKKRAVRVMRPGSRITPRRARRAQPTTTRQGTFAMITGLLMLAAIGWYGYSRLATDRTQPPASAAPAIQILPVAPSPTFTCDGRTRCSQMTSCAEATFFIKQCPGTQMDGDGDGKPCESQWCGGSWAD